jgi:hypothetical protein
MPSEESFADDPLGRGEGIDGAVDPFGDDIFTREIVNISESDWDLDTNELWGDAVDITDPGADAFGGELSG